MSNTPTKRTVFIIWLGWAVIMLAYSLLVPARFTVRRPDNALFWTANSTKIGGEQDKKYYLQDPFMEPQVAWDSEYYLAIAIGGYDDPNIDRIGGIVQSNSGPGFWPFVIPQGAGGVREGVSLSHAFFPFYPFIMRILSVPLSVLGLTEIATAVLAGVIISLLGTLAATLAIFDLGQEELGSQGGLRAAFYLLIFPSAFFLSVIYTEGLFLGLAFSSLVLIRRGHRGWAALVAILATFTRAAGVVLVVPLFLSWVKDGEWLDLDLEWRQIYFKGLPWRKIGKVLIVVAPFIAFAIWKFSYFGMAFSRVEEEFFGRGLLNIGATYASWRTAFYSLFDSNLQSTAYYVIEFGAIILAFTACIAGLRKYTDLALFGLLVITLSLFSGPAQGMHRYALAAPAIYLFLSELGRKPAFDRVWTIASVLLMGFVGTMFIFDMWAG